MALITERHLLPACNIPLCLSIRREGDVRKEEGRREEGGRGNVKKAGDRASMAAKAWRGGDICHRAISLLYGAATALEEEEGYRDAARMTTMRQRRAGCLKLQNRNIAMPAYAALYTHIIICNV